MPKAIFRKHSTNKPSELKNINSEFDQLIERIKFATKLNLEGIEKRMNYAKGRLSQVKSKNQVSERLLKNLENEFRSDLDSIMNEEITPYTKRPSNNDPLDAGQLSIQAIVNLTESNRLMAESQVSLAKSHEELVQMVKNSTGNVAKETLKAVGAKLLALQEFVIEQAVKKQSFQSKQEAQAFLNTITNDILKDGK